MMYEVFQERLLEAIREGLQKKHTGTEVKITKQLKNNSQERVGIMFITDSEISPVLYIDDLYWDYQHREHSKSDMNFDIEKIAETVIRNYEDCISHLTVERNDIKGINDFESCRNKVVFRLVNSKMNETLLKSVPHIEFLDLSVIFQVLLESSCENTASVQIRNQFIEQWGITTEELFEVAMNNTKSLLPATFYTMQHAFEKMYKIEDIEDENLLQETNEDQRDLMYVLTNTTCNYGAAVIIYPNILEMIGDILCEDFCVIPSSVHEILIVPKSTILEPEMMDELVQEVNEGQLAPEEVLGTHVYYFNRETKKITY